MPTSNNQAWYLGDNAGDLAYLHSVVGEQNIVSTLRLSDVPPSVPVLLVVDVDVVSDWELQLSDVDIGSAKVALVSSASMSQVFIRSMYGDSPRRWYLGRLVPGTLPDSFVRALGACLHSENEVMRLELSVLRGKLKSLEEERSLSAGAESKLRSEIEDSREVLAKVTADLEKLSTEKSEAEAQFVVVEEKLLATERSLLDSREAGDHSRKLVADVQDELTSLRTERSTLAQIAEEKEASIQDLSQLLGDNQAAVERLKVLNSELADKLKHSEDESSKLSVRLQDELERLAAAHESVKEANAFRDEAVEKALLADSEREAAEVQRESANQSAIEATKEKEEAEKLVQEYSFKVQESKQAAADATKLAEQLKDESAKAIGEAEARTLEAYGILSERTEALEEECLLAATLGEENRELKETSKKVQVQLEEKEVELSDSLSLAKDLTAKLDIAVVDVQRAQNETLASDERAAIAEKSASESASLAESEKSACIAAIARADQAELAQADSGESLALIGAAKKELEERLELSQSRIESLGTECQGLLARVDEVTEELSSAVQAHNSSMLAQEEELSATIERLNLEKDQALTEAKADSDTQMANADAESEKALSAQAEHHKNELASALDANKRASEAQLDRVIEEHRINSADRDSRHVEAIAQLKEENDSRLTEVANSHSEAIAQLKEENDSRLTEVANSHSEAIAQLKEENDSRLTEVANSHSEAVASLEGDIVKLRKDLEAAVSVQREAERLRDEASELSAIANTQRDAALEQVSVTNQRASDAENRAILAESEAVEAMGALGESRIALDRLQALSRENESAYLSEKESLEERLEILTLDLRQRAEDASVVINERDKLSLDLKDLKQEVELQLTLNDKSTEENEYLKHENREISTKLVALESIHSQHEAEFEELRRTLDGAELTLKETLDRERTALSSLSDAELRIERQSSEYEAKISQIVHERSADKKAMTLDVKDLESRLSAALEEVVRLKAANTEAVGEIASLRADQSQSASIVHPTPASAVEPILAEGIKSEVESIVARAPQGSDSRAKRLEEELAEANSRLRATSSGVVWSARREPEVKEGLLGRLKGSISRNGDN